jgi:hypothetical protein
MLNGQKVEIKTSEGFAPLPADKYTVQVVDVDLKTQLKYQSTQEEEVLNYKFQILDDNPMPKEQGEEDATTRGRFVWKPCRPSINSRSHLGKLAAAVEGRTLTKEEAENFDPESIVGRQLDVMVNKKPSKKDPDIFYNNVIDFVKALKELEPLPIEKRETEVVEKTTKAVAPTTAPDAEADLFADNLEKEGQNIVKAEEVGQTPEEAEAEAAELEAAAAVAVAKAAKAKALAAKAK